mmetsp:Transcript_38525/g.39210  ORF Transcript_38525/g.39210 Transcript_38525/m.39210 type:complete len:203 (+) Transcript_38525:229-837(+)
MPGNIIFAATFLGLLYSSVQTEQTMEILEGTFLPSNEIPYSLANHRIILNNGEFSALSRTDGRFLFYQIPSGIYLLEVDSPSLYFSKFKLKVNAENNTLSILEYKYPGAHKLIVDSLSLSPHGRPAYFQKRPPLSLLSLVLSNPMMAVMIAMFGMMILFPGMLSSLNDPEMQRANEELQAEMGDPMKEIKKALGMDMSNEEE